MCKAMDNLLGKLGPEIDDHEEEAFLLFSQSHPSQNLGFVDAKATTLHLTINNKDLTITQSPTVLTSNRAGGTTGAVVWNVTPLFAAWLSAPGNILFAAGILAPTSTVLELGCGVSALVGLATGPRVARYVLTDQSYVGRLVEHNIAQNGHSHSHNHTNAPKPVQATTSRKSRAKAAGGGGGGAAAAGPSSSATRGNVEFQALDWETDTPHASLCTPDVIVACDCIYNDALIPPLVQTCVDACRLKARSLDLEEERESTGEGGDRGSDRSPCISVVAQQLRDPEIFEAWLKEFMAQGFRVWRLPDEELPVGLRESSGFVVHIGILREAFES